MSAHRIKIKTSRKARQQAASASNSASTFSAPQRHNIDGFRSHPDEPECPPVLDFTTNPTEAEMQANLEAFDRYTLACFPHASPYLTAALKSDAAKSAPAHSLTSTAAAAAPTPVPAAPTPAPTLPAPGQSTGPRTLAGKSHSSHNALKHGLTMPAGPSMTFLPHEDTDAHTLLLFQFNQQFVPMTGAETEIVREIVDALWLARRARDLQTSALETSDLHALSLYLRYETAHQRAHNAAIKTLLVLQKDRRQRNQNHKEWDEPLLWGDLNFISTGGSASAMSSAPTAATTSESTTASDSSFRNSDFKPQYEMHSNPNATQTVSGNKIEEAKVAA
jgi:hypothetical protein